MVACNKTKRNDMFIKTALTIWVLSICMTISWGESERERVRERKRKWEAMLAMFGEMLPERSSYGGLAYFSNPTCTREPNSFVSFSETWALITSSLQGRQWAELVIESGGLLCIRLANEHRVASRKSGCSKESVGIIHTVLSALKQVHYTQYFLTCHWCR